MRVLVTGATGRLGTEVVRALQADGHEVRAMSSRPGAAVVRADLRTGEGLREALDGVEAVVHAASAPRGDVQQVDVEGTRRLVRAADPAVLRHLVHVSIVGVDRNPYRYYRAKLAAERVVLDSGLPVTVVRAAQFQEFVDDLLGLARCGPVLPVPAGWALQPVAVAEVARYLLTVLARPAASEVVELAGPEVLDSAALARLWAAAQVRRPRVVPLRLPGRVSRAFRSGSALPEGGARGRRTYAQHLGQGAQP